MRFIVSITASILFMTCAESFAQGGDVVFMTRSTPSLLTTFDAQMDCRQNISKIVCLVDPWDPNSGVSSIDRPCLVGSQDFVHFFEAHYDRSEAMIQKMYCHMEKIWIENQLDSTAYATFISDSRNGPMVAGAIGIRRQVVDTTAQLDHWISWKDEINFGGSKTISDPSIGVVKYRSNQNSNDGLLDLVLNHEFGHLFDFANSINKIDDCRWEKQPDGNYKQVGTCAFASGSFGLISWATAISPIRTEFNFPGSEQICFYSCKPDSHIDPKFSLELYSGVEKTNFISIYASSNAMEDWAEMFSSYWGYEVKGRQMSLVTQGLSFDLRRHYFSPQMGAKRDYVHQFVKSAYKYPGE